MRRRQTSVHATDVGRRYRDAGLWGDRLLVDWVDAHAVERPDKTALIDSRGSLTYRDVAEQSENLAVALMDLGIRPGDVVAVQAPNWAELPISHLALDRLGAIFLPLHDGFREAETGHLLARSRARAIIAPATYRGFSHRELVSRLRPSLPDLEHVIVLRADPDGQERSFDGLATDGRWRGTRAREDLARLRPDPDEPLQVLVSSGTTALPKCSLYSDNNTLARLVHGYARHAVQLTTADVAAALAPAGTGATGYTYPILGPLVVGATAVLLERWSGERADEALTLIEQHRCTYAVAIPTQLAKLIALPDPGSRDLRSLRFISNAGARLPEVVAEATERLLGCPIQTIYGASDAAAATMTAIDDPRTKRWTTVGRALPGQEVRISDDRGRALEPGHVGEVCWRGAAKSYGYLNDAEGTRAVWDDEGWYHSGDLGEVDAEGYLRIVGRRKDMIIRGGRNINPRAIEEVLVAHPAVLDVAVVAVPDPVLGERVCAFVVPRDAMPAPRLEDLTGMIRSRGMAAWYQPEQLVLVADFPRNAGAKVDKAALIRMVSQAAEER